MIIYPIIILGLLLVALGIFYRRAYLVSVEGLAEKEETTSPNNNETKNPLLAIKEKLHLPNIPTFKKKANVEIEVNLEQETDPNILKADDLFSKKQFISAEKWYLEAVRNNPKNAKIYSRLGIIYIEQKNYKDAIEALAEAIKLDDHVASRFFNLSFALNALGDKKLAIQQAKRAMRLEGSNKKYRKWFDELRLRGY